MIVSAQTVRSYQRQSVALGVEELLRPLGGMKAFVKPGQKVLLKPNMLMAKSPDQAVTTHPEVVRAVIEQVKACGAIPLVGDSPGYGQPRKVAEACGIWPVMEEAGAEFSPFEESVKIPVGQGAFRNLEVAKDFLDADVVINLPKLKTHQMMGLTCGVKNLFGAIIGMRKPGLHLQAGADKGLFAKMLIDLADRLAPALTIVDGIVGMEGDGPSGGTPVEMGVLMASSSPLAVDTLACELTGLSPEQVWTQKIAIGLGRPEAELPGIQLEGPPLSSLKHLKFKPSKTTDIHFGLPPLLRKPLRKALTARPVIDHNICVRCGLCVKHCPPEVMELKHRVSIDDAACIQCFCCQELCPHHAIATRQGWLLKLLIRLKGDGAQLG